MPKDKTHYNETSLEKPKGIWDRLEGMAVWKLMLVVLAFGLSERLLVMAVLFLRFGWQTVSGIELWFYYGVAKGTFSLYSAWDPSAWILGGLGALFSGMPLLYSVYLVSSLSSSLNASLFCLFVSELHDRRTGLIAGLVYASAVLPMFNSAGTVTHDIFGYPYLILALYGALLAVRRRGIGWKLGGAAISLIGLFLGRHVGPTILTAVGTLIIYLLWVGVRAFAAGKKVSRFIIPGVVAILVLAAVWRGGDFIFGAVKDYALLVALAAVAVFFSVLQVFRLSGKADIPEIPAALVGLAAFGFMMLSRGYELFGKEAGFPWERSWRSPPARRDSWWSGPFC